MYQSKSRRKLFQVDMFPMFNLLLILLFFLLIAGKPREQSPIDVDLPLGHSFNMTDPDEGSITILQGQGKIMLKTDYEDVRKEALILMGDIYHLTFSPAELLKFSKINTIGVPVSALKKYMAGYYNSVDYYGQNGIPIATGNELLNWIVCLRKATFKLHGIPAHVNIQADKETGYPIIKNMIAVLQKQKVNRFSIIYSYVWER